MIKVCPRCQSRYSVYEYDIDYVHQCNDTYGAGSSLVYEDVKLLGDWSDYTGSGTSPFGTNVLLQGAAPKNWGEESYIQGEQPSLIYMSQSSAKFQTGATYENGICLYADDDFEHICFCTN